jgi:hypothetical protein
MGEFQATLPDLCVVAAYLIGALGLGFHVGRKTKDAEDYFLAGRRLVWPLVGLMQIHFLYACLALFVFNGLIMAAVSLATSAPAREAVAQYSWSRKTYAEEGRALRALPWYQNYRCQAGLLLLLTVFIVGYFR